MASSKGFMANVRRESRQKEKGVAELTPQGTLINTFAPDMVLAAAVSARVWLPLLWLGDQSEHRP